MSQPEKTSPRYWPSGGDLLWKIMYVTANGTIYWQTATYLSKDMDAAAWFELRKASEMAADVGYLNQEQVTQVRLISDAFSLDRPKEAHP